MVDYLAVNFLRSSRFSRSVFYIPQPMLSHLPSFNYTLIEERTSLFGPNKHSFLYVFFGAPPFSWQEIIDPFCLMNSVACLFVSQVEDGPGNLHIFGRKMLNCMDHSFPATSFPFELYLTSLEPYFGFLKPLHCSIYYFRQCRVFGSVVCFLATTWYLCCSTIQSAIQYVIHVLGYPFFL